MLLMQVYMKAVANHLIYMTHVSFYYFECFMKVL